MKRSVVVVLCATAVASACMSGGPKHDPAADIAGIGKVRDAYMAAFKAGNAAAMGALYTADAKSMGNSQPTATGPQGVEASMKGMMEQMTPNDIVITPEKTEVDGDLAYEVGTYKTTVTPKTAGAPPTTEDGRYVVVLKRQADGSWKLAEEIGNTPTPPPAMAAPAPAKAKAPAKPPAKAPPQKKK